MRLPTHSTRAARTYRSAGGRTTPSSTPRRTAGPVYGAPSILGDVQYNCSSTTYSETAIGVKDERQETTSVSEKVSLKVSLSFIGLAKSSAEFEAFSKQSNSVSAAEEVQNAVAVPPLYKGWTVTRALTGTVNGSAYVTDGIDLIEVKNIDLSFPGFRDPADTSNDPILYTGIKQPMDADDIKAACTDLDEGIDTDQLVGTAQARASEFELGLCRASDRCTSRTVRLAATRRPPRRRAAQPGRPHLRQRKLPPRADQAQHATTVEGREVQTDAPGAPGQVPARPRPAERDQDDRAHHRRRVSGRASRTLR